MVFWALCYHQNGVQGVLKKKKKKVTSGAQEKKVTGLKTIYRRRKVMSFPSPLIFTEMN